MMFTALLLTASALTASVAAQPKLPTFKTFITNVSSVAVTPGGGKQRGVGVSAYDATTNTSSWRGHGQDFVATFNQNIVYFTTCGNRGCACDYTCSLDGDTMCQTQLDGNALCGFDYEHRSKFVKNVTTNGVPTMHFHYGDPLGPISMADHDVYITMDGTKVVRFVADFHPFLKEVAKITSDYTDFTPGVPPPSAFAFTGGANCPKGTSDECTNTMRNARATGLLRFD